MDSSMNSAKEYHSAKEIDSCYNENYFHGIGSGYGSKGYEYEHADWSALVQWVKSYLGSSIHWLDLGCAYGYLVQQATVLGIDAFGLDISSYALHQIQSIRAHLVQGLTDCLPLQDHSIDVISLFDVIEHLQNPENVFDEVERVLRPDGICFLSTPDPLYFPRHEPTHIHERPPSFWIKTFRDRGWNLSLRFGGNPYELEMIACRSSRLDWERIQQEFSTQHNSLYKFIERQGDDFVCIPRIHHGGNVLSDNDCLYLCNSSKDPQEYFFSLHTENERHPHVFISDLKLRYLGNERTEQGFLHQWTSLPLSPGGHDIVFHVDGDSIPIHRLEIKAVPFDRQRFLLELPFDHYQRYQFVSQKIKQLGNESLTILDVGGALGYLSLFLPTHSVTVVDRVMEDIPNSVQYKGWKLPFADRTFDIVVAIDTLEHISQDKRNVFLLELTRLAKSAVWVCGPFNEFQVAETEFILREFLDHHLHRHDRFLAEHAQYTLPTLQNTVNLLQKSNLVVAVWANGFLPRWLFMQVASFTMGGIPELSESSRYLNSLYNRNYFDADNCTPAYRSLVAAFRDEIPPSLQETPTIPTSTVPPATMWPVAHFIASISMMGVLREKDSFLENQGQRLEQFLNHLKNLESALQEERIHTTHLDEFLKQHTDRLHQLQIHGDNLFHLLDEQKVERNNFQSLLTQTSDRNQELIKHTQNLEALLLSQLKHSENLDSLLHEKQRHSDNLQTMLQENQKHAQNLESMLQENQKHTRNLESMLQENQKHAHNLEELVHQQQNQFRETMDRLGLGPFESISKGLFNIESQIQTIFQQNQQLSNQNRDLIHSLQMLQQSLPFRILRKLGWIPKDKESNRV